LGVWGDPQVGRPEQYLDDQKHTTRWRIICYSGVVASDNYSYSYKLLVTFSISIRTTHLCSSSYSEYQEYLFNRIRGLKEHFLTPIGYRKISQILNEEGQ